MPPKLWFQLSSACRWRKIRFERIELAGGICEACHKEPATQVHHHTYVGYGWERLSDLAAVCDTCHAKIHGYFTEANNDNEPELPLAISG